MDAATLVESRAPRASRSSPRPTRVVEHVYGLDNVGLVRLFSGASSKGSVPQFTDGQDIAGVVNVEPSKFEGVQAITVQVTGRLITGRRQEDVLTFVERSEVLYKRASPRGSPTPRSESPPTHAEAEGHCFPFSMQLPRKVALSSKTKHSGMFGLPHSYEGADHDESVTVKYTVSVVLERGRFSKNVSVLKHFLYTPHVRPDEMSRMRQTAYEDNEPLYGPEMDAAGWKTFDAIHTTVEDNMQFVPITCMFSLANPLSYTRNTLIPCAMTLKVNQPRSAPILDQLCSRRSIVVRLQRTLTYEGRDAGKADVSDIQEAVFQPSVDDYHHSPTCRQLQGEILLPKSMMPTTHMASLKISYSVVLFPFREDASRFSGSECEPLLSVPVEIATKHSRGVKPRSFGPVGPKL